MMVTHISPVDGLHVTVATFIFLLHILKTEKKD